jgi:nitroimidazol reductase NimA-like FMN-containing flavoprotein (pyridoxamine 5'-phosphate oxidase superfamily)
MTVEELKPYGLEEMRDEEISDFLASQSTGVLGLPGEEMPYLLVLSYGFDGDSALYFTYLLGAESEKERRTEAAERAPFLVYSAETMFSWRSVLLEGTFERLTPSEWNDVAEHLDGVWRPEIFEAANTERNVAIYEYAIDEWSGIRHTGLSPQYE